MSEARVEKAVRHYQKDIELPGIPSERVLYCIEKLYRLPVTVQHLQDTGVGRTVNALRKGDGDVAIAARALVTKWKQMVADEEDAQEYQQNVENKEQQKAEDDEDDDDDDDDDDDEGEDEETCKKEPSPEPVRVSEEKRIKEKYNNNKDNQEIQRLEKHKRECEDEDSYHKYKEYKKRRHEESDQYEYSKNHQSHNYNEKDHNNRQHSTKSTERNHVPESPETLPNSEPEFHIDEPNLSEESEDEQQKQTLNHKQVISNEVDKYSQSSSKESSKSHSKHRSSSSSKSSSSKHEEKKSKHRSEEKSDRKHSRDRSKDHTDSKKHKHSQEKEQSHNNKDKERENKKKSKHHDEKYNDKKKEKHSDKQKSDKERSKSDKHREHKSKDDAQRSSSSSKSKPTSEHKHKKQIQTLEDGIGCESGASFAEALGMINPGKSTPSSKKKSSHSSSNHSSSSKSRSNGNTSNKEDKPLKKEQNPATLSLQSKLATQPSLLLAPDMKLSPLPPLTVSISALPEISPNYVPRPAPRLMESIVPNISEEEALSVVMNTKNQRTKVFSGNRVIHGSIPTLYELCSYVLQENIDALEYTGGVPYDLLKPVIEKATPNQLFTLEHYNPYLIDDTDELWQIHCQKAFRMQKRQEMESWRDMFMRCTDEQEAKLKSLTANIKSAQDKCLPVRQTKMAYVDSVVKPPRNIARKQAIYGTARKPAVSPAARVASLAGNNVVKGAEVKGAGTSSGAPRSTGFIKPKKAPLMQKALQLIKGRYKR